MIKFGPAGNSNSFYEQKYKSTIQAMKWIHDMGLNAYEYQCNRGVNISKEKAVELGLEAKKYGISLSIHAPYFISLSSEEKDKQDKSIKYITDSMQAAKNMGADRVIVHAGSLLNLSRDKAVENSCKLLELTIKEARKLGLGDIHICPETMGKINQLGTVDEIIKMCMVDDSFIPTIDFGHINAREQGILKTESDFENLLNKFISYLGYERMKHFHCHFSKIEYTVGGEKKHLTLEDTKFGPDFTPLAKTLKKLQLYPTIICESDGVQAEDASKLNSIYSNI